MNLVIDSNIFIAAILRDGKIRELMVKSPYILLLPEVIYEEITEHKEELIKKSGLSEEDFNALSILISEYIRIVPDIQTLAYKTEAEIIIGKIDPDDTPFFATSLAFGSCPIWSDDSHLRKQTKIKIISTKEMIELS
jgi:predicted nucleic acid-binding protein